MSFIFFVTSMSKKKWWLFLLLSPIWILILYFIVSLIFRIISIKIWVSVSEKRTILYASRQLVYLIILILWIVITAIWIPVGTILISQNYDRKKFIMKDISRQSRQKAKKKFVLYLLIILTVVVVYAIFGRVFNLHTQDPEINTMNNIINLIIWTIVLIWFTNVSLRVADDKYVKYSYFYNKIKLFFHMLGARILFGLMVLAGFILLIIPGIIRAARFQFYRFFIIEQWVNPIKALRMSRGITKWHAPELIVYQLLLYCINLLWLACLWIWLLWTLPMTMIAQAILYRKLAGIPKK